MNSPINDFCMAYKDKIKNDKDIKENEVDVWSDCRDRISFFITEHRHAPGYTYMVLPGTSYGGKRLLSLDEEDIKYLYNKYSKKLEEELTNNINKLKEEYE